jgi:hypothetical protein
MTASQPTSSDDPKSKIDLSMTQVAASSLAAVTAAVLGSGLGVAGTLIGAAGASAITTVATAVYRASLERSGQRVRSLARRTQPVPTSLEEARTERFRPVAAHPAPGSEPPTERLVRLPQPGGRSRRLATLRWGAVSVGALGAFMLAMMVITGFEWASGETVGGNGAGTSLGRVVKVDPAPGQRGTGVRPELPSSSVPTSEAPTDTSESSETSSTPTETAVPSDEADAELSPSTTSDAPTPTTVTPTSPVVPTEFPIPGSEQREP